MKIILLQWNIWYKEDPQKVAECIADIRPDIMCLQEVVATSFRPYVTSADSVMQKLGKPYRGYYVAAQQWINQQGNIDREQGNAIISRYPLSSPSHVETQTATSSSDFASETRAYSQVELNIGADQPLCVGTTHASYTDRFMATPQRDLENYQ